MPFKYANGPVVYLYDLETRKKKMKKLLWGDWLRIAEDIDTKWSKVKWGRKEFAIRKSDYQDECLLEMIFLDVGQGDGCILTAPDMGSRECIMIIDAGKSDNMERYLNWRFRDFKNRFLFHAAIITHPDEDHYRGFQAIFDNPNISFENVYHNGLLERTGKQLLGPVKNGFVTDVRASQSAAHALYKVDKVRGRKRYPKLIWTALTSDRFKSVSMLSASHGTKENGRTWMPGFAPAENRDLTIEVLGPVVQKGPGGKPALRTFGKTLSAKSMDNGKTKNGHSILLKLQYREFSVLFGGDLNSPAEHFLMRHYGNDGKAPETLAETEAMISEASKRFRVDLMKSCHHGSSDVTDEFLNATAPAGYVVSSGDDESHVHPRPDLLGLLGKMGRGQRPLVLCTEILRSTRESESGDLRKKIDRINARLDSETDAEKIRKLREELAQLVDHLFKRNVGVYGAINLRTDGKKAVIAFRKEKKTLRRWFTYELEPDVDGIFQVASEAGH